MAVSTIACLVLLFLLSASHIADAAVTPESNVTFTIPSSYSDWSVTLRPFKGTLAALHPNMSDPFSFINNDTAANYSSHASYHSHGDITLLVRPAHNTSHPYTAYTTAAAHSPPALPVDTADGELAAWDVSGLMRPGSGLRVVRRWGVAALNTSETSSGLTMEVVVENVGGEAVELGGFGVSALFSSNWNDMDLSQAAAYCSLAEPYIGGEHGYVKVTRLTGTGRVLLMTAAEGQRATSGLTAWRQLKGDDRTPTGYAFEGHYEWTSVVGAWQDQWKQSQPWVEPTRPTITLARNESVTFRYTYQLIDSVRGVDEALVSQGNVSIRAVPGYILSTEMQTAKLYIHPPAGTTTLTFNITGAGNLALTRDTTAQPGSPYLVYRMSSRRPGRVHVAVHFPAAPGSGRAASTAHVSLLVLPPLRGHLQSLGAFTAKNQWVGSEVADPFGRSSSVMPYDFEDGEIIWQDDRSYVVGLSDEAGAGPGLQLMMSQRYAPVAAALLLVDEYINKTLWGVKTPPEVPYPTSIQNANHSIRASMFWYPGMPNYTYSVQGGWDQERGSELWRSYNYVHPTVLYHSMYRLARDYDGMRRLYPWSWYLSQAYATFIAMFDNAPYYTQFGLMEGSVFLDLMEDLRLEGWTEQYQRMYKLQQQRVGVWQQLPFPFGSEMPWDSTGQEEIWLSAQAFGSYALSNSSLLAILAYTHPIPVWAYHGSSRRWWDFWINGKPNYTQAWPERNLHHYGSSLNGKPLLRAYEISPDDYYILEPAIGAMSGVLSNIQPNGAASMGFHGDNALLKHDPFDADYGCALYGHVTSATSYFVQHPTFGPSCYLCNYRQSAAGEWTIVPVDSLHRRVYLEPLGTAIAVDVGRITSVLLSMANRTVVVALADEVGEFSAWRVSVVHYALCGVRPGCDLRVVSPAVTEVRGAWSFPVSSNSPTVTLTWGGSESDSSSERREEKLEVRTAERTAVA